MQANIRLGDCRVVLVDALWDVMITDPPYREHVHMAATSCGTPGAKPTTAAKGAAHRELGFDHLSNELRIWTCEMAARTKKWSCIFTDVESVGEWKRDLESVGATYIRSIPWIRWSMPQLSGDRPPQGHEMIVLAWGSNTGKKSWNGPGNLTHFAQTCMRGKNKHKAQKPLDLILELVEFFSSSDDLVCDPFLGSGTTGKACSLLGRDFVGSELDSRWASDAATRVFGTHACYDDEERWKKYMVAHVRRHSEMQRMAENTARIRANREAQQ